MEILILLGSVWEIGGEDLDKKEGESGRN